MKLLQSDIKCGVVNVAKCGVVNVANPALVMPLPLTYLPGYLHTYSHTHTASQRKCTAPNYVGLTFGGGTHINQVNFFICNWAYTYWPTAQLQYKHIAFHNLSLNMQRVGRCLCVCVCVHLSEQYSNNLRK